MGILKDHATVRCAVVDKALYGTERFAGGYSDDEVDASLGEFAEQVEGRIATVKDEDITRSKPIEEFDEMLPFA